MRLLNVVQAVITIGLAGVSAGHAQRPTDPVVAVPRFDASLGYQYIDANAPPGGCKCFGLSGGYISAGLHLNQWLGVEAQFTGTHAGNISLLGQDLTLMTYMAGPRVQHHYHRLVPFGQALFGGARGSNSYFPTATGYTTNASSFALSAGGGLDYDLTPRFAIRAIEASYLKTSLPNGTTNSQNHLMLGAGIIMKFRGREKHDDAPVIPQAPNKVTGLACSTKTQEVKEGQNIDVMGRATTLYSKGEVIFSWASSGGNVQGSGPRVAISTSGLAGGDYVITGHARLADSSDVADCEVTFHVIAKPPPPLVIDIPQPPPPPAPDEKVFHDNVPDALFDYDKWAIRSDTQLAINKAAAYLIAHPKMRVLIGGYSDERGTSEYNMSLGLKRANATMQALVAAGVPADRMQVISYGKGAQVCTAENEACWQQNRRAAFSLHP